MATRRAFLRISGLTGAGLLLPLKGLVKKAWASLPGGSLNPSTIPRFVTPLVIPPAMPRTGKFRAQSRKLVDYYEIAVRQFQQHILPQGMGLPPTTVWSYGSVNHPGSFNYPAFTIEAKWQAPVRTKWINDLKDSITGEYLPHLLPVDQTLHWANPPGGLDGRDGHGMEQAPYMGPVPIVTHLHGAHTFEESDGFAEAWYLPDASNIPYGDATTGSHYGAFNAAFQARYGAAAWAPGTAVFQYPNDQRATTLWYHDHSLGMTRLNVYAGPAGFYVLRGGPADEVIDTRKGTRAVLPGPAPALGDPPGMKYYEIPIAIQDRSFNGDGSLFYPDTRAFFEGLDPSQLQIPFHPDVACDGMMSDVAPIWQPEFFGNTMVVNGKTWPYLQVEQRRYRFRFLNGCNSRFLILKFDDPRVEVWQIGAEGGFLPGPVPIHSLDVGGLGGVLLMGLAERADVIVDFSNVPVGTSFRLLNLGPDEPFGGFPTEGSEAETTGQVMEFRVAPSKARDTSTPPQFLALPAIPAIDPGAAVRPLSLNEGDSQTVRYREDNGNWVLDCSSDAVFGPTAALLGTLGPGGMSTPLKWDDPETETPAVGSTETWEFYNFTADAHPIHIHLVQFRVVDRQALETDEESMATQPTKLVGDPRPPEAWEAGYKDTVIAYPGEVTRVQATFDYPGLYVWHCHIVEHEDNEMMRPYRVTAS